MTEAKAKSDPFGKVKSSAASKKKSSVARDVPEEIKTAIDAFKEAKDALKNAEFSKKEHGSVVQEFAMREFAAGIMAGKSETSFDLQGNEATVKFVTQFKSLGGITGEEKEAIAEKWGEAVANEVCLPDLGTVRFDAEVLAANYDAVVAALQTLPEEILSNLLKPMTMKTASLETIKKHARNADDLIDLLKAVKYANYVS